MDYEKFPGMVMTYGPDRTLKMKNEMGAHLFRWYNKMKMDEEFSKYRFKTLKEHVYPYMHIPYDIVDDVDEETFFTEEPYRLPLFMGCQFGVGPKIKRIVNGETINMDHLELFNGSRIAILGKSVLSGCVGGFSIFDIVDHKRELIKKFSNDLEDDDDDDENDG